MKMICPDMSHELIWDEDQHVHEIVIESPSYWCKIIRDLLAHDESGTGVSLTSGGKVLKFDEEIDIIFNPVDLDFNKRQVMLNLIKSLTQTGKNEDNYLATQELKAKVASYIIDLIECEHFNFSVSTDEFSLMQLAKVVGLHIESNEESLCEQILDYLEVMHTLAGTKLHIFVNLRSFLRLDDLNDIIHEINNRQLDVLLLESSQKEKIDNVPMYIIDKDLCEI